MKTKKTPKPRRMWANYCANGYAPVLFCLRKNAHLGGMGAQQVMVPVAVIPLDDVEGLVEKAYQAFFNSSMPNDGTMKGGIRAALTAIGVPPKQRKKGGRK